MKLRYRIQQKARWLHDAYFQLMFRGDHCAHVTAYYRNKL